MFLFHFELGKYMCMYVWNVSAFCLYPDYEKKVWMKHLPEDIQLTDID